MGVVIEGAGFSSYDAARFAGRVALTDFLDALTQERLREKQAEEKGS